MGPSISSRRRLKVSFVLPLFQTRVSGGFRVVYEYANHLASRGHAVTLIFPHPGLRYRGLRRYLARGAIKERSRMRQEGSHISWFDFHQNVDSEIIRSPNPLRLPDGDVVIATAWATAAYVAAAPERAGVGAYLIQHHETWSGPPKTVDATWRLPLQKIVISRWLADLAQKLDPNSAIAYIPNGMDLEAFAITRAISDRSPFKVGMLYHPSTWKGTTTGLAALARAKKEEPRLRAVIFGHPARPAAVPSWMEYRQDLRGPALNEYYNELSIFVHPSLAEGWPLPPAEAMASGAALIAADNPGVLDYAKHDSNALVVPKGEPDALAQAILQLVRDRTLRERLASAGNASIQKYTWDRATSRLEEVLQDLTEGHHKPYYSSPR